MLGALIRGNTVFKSQESAILYGEKDNLEI